MSVQTTIKKVTLEFLHEEINARMDRLETDIRDLRRESNQRFDQLYALLTQILLAAGGAPKRQPEDK